MDQKKAEKPSDPEKKNNADKGDAFLHLLHSDSEVRIALSASDLPHRFLPSAPRFLSLMLKRKRRKSQFLFAVRKIKQPTTNRMMVNGEEFAIVSFCAAFVFCFRFLPSSCVERTDERAIQRAIQPVQRSRRTNERKREQFIERLLRLMCNTTDQRMNGRAI